MIGARDRHDAILELMIYICSHPQELDSLLLRLQLTPAQGHLAEKILEACDSFYQVSQADCGWRLDVWDFLNADFYTMCQNWQMFDEMILPAISNSIKPRKRNTAPITHSLMYLDLRKPVFPDIENEISGIKDQIRCLVNETPTPRTLRNIYQLIAAVLKFFQDMESPKRYYGNLEYSNYQNYQSSSFAENALSSVFVDLLALDINPVCDILYHSGVLNQRQHSELISDNTDRCSRVNDLICILSDKPWSLVEFVQALKDDSVRQEYLADLIISVCDDYFEIHKNACMGNFNWLLNSLLKRNYSLTQLKESLLSSIKETVSPYDKSTRNIYFRIRDSNAPKSATKPLLESLHRGDDLQPEGVYKEAEYIRKRRLDEIKALLGQEEPTPRTMRHLYQTIEMYFEELEDLKRISGLLTNWGDLKVSRYKAARVPEQSNVVNDFTQCVLQPLWSRLVRDLEVKPVSDFLYENGHISRRELNELTNDSPRDDRARKLLNFVGERPESLVTFVQALKQDTVGQSTLAEEIVSICDGYFMLDEEKHASVVGHLKKEFVVIQPEMKELVLDEIKETVVPDEGTVRDIYFDMEDSSAPENMAQGLLREVKSDLARKRNVQAEEVKKEADAMTKRRQQEMKDLLEETAGPRVMRHLYQLVKVYAEEQKDIQRIYQLAGINDDPVKASTSNTEVKQVYEDTQEEKLLGETEVKRLAGETEAKETPVKELVGDTEETAVKVV